MSIMAPYFQRGMLHVFELIPIFILEFFNNAKLYTITLAALTNPAKRVNNPCKSPVSLLEIRIFLRITKENRYF